jgi:hypothetical protein|tara:strand:- start:217 stop:372 length:156 start_codon:yes stop_codon:yes gene_type:complete
MTPVINVDTLLTITVPACTYYREESLQSEFRLYVHLQMGEGFPPMPKPGDY